MVLQLAGAFRREAETDGDAGLHPWGCPLCATGNESTDDDPSSRCKTCQRLRSPQWLHLEDWGLQLELGSRVFYTSVGGSKAVSVVVALDYVQKVATLLRVKANRNEGGQRGAISFHEVVLNASQMQQQLGPLDAEQEGGCVLDNYGVCGECRGIFRVAQGELQYQYANEDRVNELRNKLQKFSEKKKLFARGKKYNRALECTEQIKLVTKQLQVAKRELEFLTPVFCPFCGWSPR